MTAFQLSLPGFEGPVDALHPMVSARQLALEELPLAAIPAQFLAEAEGRGALDLDLAGEVLAAVARLMLLKSLHLLAEPEEEMEDETAVSRHAGTEMPALRLRAADLSTQQGRPVFPAPGRMDLVPRLIRPRPAAALIDSWTSMRERDGKKLVRAAVPAFVRLEVAVSRIMSRLRTGRTLSLSALVARGNRRDVVMHFLAMLELVRRGQVRVDQSCTFAEITLEWADTDDRQHSRAG